MTKTKLNGIQQFETEQNFLAFCATILANYQSLHIATSCRQKMQNTIAKIRTNFFRQN